MIVPIKFEVVSSNEQLAVPPVTLTMSAPQVNAVYAQSPPLEVRGPDVDMTVHPSSINVSNAEPSTKELTAPDVAVKVNASHVAQIDGDAAPTTIEVNAPPVQASVRAPEVHVSVEQEKEISIVPPAVIAAVSAPEVEVAHAEPSIVPIAPQPAKALIRAPQIDIEQEPSSPVTVQPAPVTAIVSAPKVDVQQQQPSSPVTVQPAPVKAVVGTSSVEFEHEQPPAAIAVQPAPVLAIVGPPSVEIQQEQLPSPVIVPPAPVQAIVSAPSVDVQHAPTTELQITAPPVKAVIAASDVVVEAPSPADGPSVEIKAPPITARVAASDVTVDHVPSPVLDIDLAAANTRQETPSHLEPPQNEGLRRPKTSRSEASTTAHVSHQIHTSVGNANVGCQGTFVTNNFFLTPTSNVRPDTSTPSGASATCEEEANWVAQLTNMLLLCTGCAIAQALAEKLRSFTDQPAQDRRRLVLVELQKPECQRTVLGAAAADLEARFTLRPSEPRDVVWSGSVAKAVTEALGSDLDAFRRMNDLCRLYVSNANRDIPAPEVLAITAGPNQQARCDLPLTVSRPHDLAAHAGFMLDQIGPGPAMRSCPVSAFGSVPALQLLTELTRRKGHAVVHEFSLECSESLVVYTVTNLRKCGEGVVSGERVLHDDRGAPVGVSPKRVTFPRKGWFLVAVAVTFVVSDGD
jgi:hypothetical protein